MNKKDSVYMAIGEKMPWDSNKQIPLGKMSWKQAVTIAKLQDCYEVRLSHTKGFNNQGHYIRTNKAF